MWWSRSANGSYTLYGDSDNRPTQYSPRLALVGYNSNNPGMTAAILVKAENDEPQLTSGLSLNDAKLWCETVCRLKGFV
jgi:hypothetical protein